MDTAAPMLQLRGTILAGTSEPLIGSELLFTNTGHTPVQNQEDELPSTHSTTIEPFSLASRHIAFRQVTLHPKAEIPQDKDQSLPLKDPKQQASRTETEMYVKYRPVADPETTGDGWDIQKMTGNTSNISSAVEEPVVQEINVQMDVDPSESHGMPLFSFIPFSDG
jgi:hypothetical protein